MPTIAHQLERAIEEGNKQAKHIATLKVERDILLAREDECKAARLGSGADLTYGDWKQQIRVFLHWQFRPGIDQIHRYFELRRIVKAALDDKEAECNRLKPIVEDLAALLPRIPIALFPYNSEGQFKALAMRAVEALADQEPKSSGDHN